VKTHVRSFIQILIQYATEQREPLYARARGREFLLDPPGTACKLRSALDMRMR